MTKREKEKRARAIAELISIIKSHGFKADRYGNWKRAATNGLPTFRFKFNPNKIRFEKLLVTQWEKSWIRIFSVYYRDLDQKLGAIKDYLDRL